MRCKNCWLEIEKIPADPLHRWRHVYTKNQRCPGMYAVPPEDWRPEPLGP